MSSVCESKSNEKTKCPRYTPKNLIPFPVELLQMVEIDGKMHFQDADELFVQISVNGKTFNVPCAFILESEIMQSQVISDINEKITNVIIYERSMKDDPYTLMYPFDEVSNCYPILNLIIWFIREDIPMIEKRSEKGLRHESLIDLGISMKLGTFLHNLDVYILIKALDFAYYLNNKKAIALIELTYAVQLNRTKTDLWTTNYIRNPKRRNKKL